MSSPSFLAFSRLHKIVTLCVSIAALTCVSAIGTHHHEYGFPSTHTTNSVSIALFFFTLLHKAYTRSTASIQNPTAVVVERVLNGTFHVSDTAYHILSGVLLFYVFSIVYGRLYTGMHSFTDCICGFVLGTGIWALHMFYSDTLHVWIRDSDWIGERPHPM